MNLLNLNSILVLSLIISSTIFAEGNKFDLEVPNVSADRLQVDWKIDQTIQIPVNQRSLRCTDLSSSGESFSSYIKLLWPEYSSLGGQLDETTWGLASSNFRDFGSQCEATSQYFYQIISTLSFLTRLETLQRIENKTKLKLSRRFSLCG